jgi:hypothetical protein
VRGAAILAQACQIARMRQRSRPCPWRQGCLVLRVNRRLNFVVNHAFALENQRQTLTSGQTALMASLQDHDMPMAVRNNAGAP